MASRIYVICDSYESGYGHGLQGDGLDLSKTPHGDQECGEAYQIGYEAGLKMFKFRQAGYKNMGKAPLECKVMPLSSTPENIFDLGIDGNLIYGYTIFMVSDWREPETGDTKMKYEYQDTAGQNFIIEDTKTGICECFTGEMDVCLQIARREDITVFTKEHIKEIFNSDRRAVESGW